MQVDGARTPFRENVAPGPPTTETPALYRRFVATALVCTMTLGATFGAYNLACIQLALGPIPPPHNWAHATFQIFGFVLMFVMGVGYHVMPRFWRASLQDLQALEAARRSSASAGEASQSLVAIVDEQVIRTTDRIERLRELREDLVRARETLHRCHACTSVPDTARCRTCLTMPSSPPLTLAAKTTIPKPISERE